MAITADTKHIFNKYFDHIFVLTIDSSKERQKLIETQLSDVAFSFFYGVNKNQIKKQDWIALGFYDEKRAISMERFSKSMSLGELACAQGHYLIYKEIIEKGYSNVLILEDDIIIKKGTLEKLNQMMNEIPKNWDILYLDYDKNEMNHLGTFLKQCFYCFQHFFGLMKFDYKMIWNYYSKPFSKHLRKAGYHYFADAYAISNYGCKKIIELQTPIIFPADHVLPWAITNELLVGFLCVPKLVMQTSQQGDGSTSMVINPFE